MKKIYLIIAFVFLFNPAINVFDILPDFIGWILISNSVERVSYLSGKMEGAKSCIDKMIRLTLVRFASVLLLPYIDGTMTLTITFVFAVLELVWSVPAFKYMYEGCMELSELYDGKGAYKPIVKSFETEKTSDGKRKTVIKYKGEDVQTVLKLTTVFLVVKNTLNVIPELLELSRHSSLIASSDVRELITYKPLVYMLLLTVMLLVGIIWLYRNIQFVNNFFSDKEFFKKTETAYKEKIIDTGIHRANIIISGIYLIAIAGIFMFGIIFDTMNIVPRFIFPLIMLFGIIKIHKNGYNLRLLISLTAISSVISLISYLMQLVFVGNNGYYNITRSFKFYNFHKFVTYFLGLEIIVFAVVVALISKLMVDVIKKETLKQYQSDAKVIKGFKIRFVFNVILFVLAGASTVIAFAVNHVFPEIWMILSALDIVWFVYSYTLYTSVRERIEDKYML